MLETELFENYELLLPSKYEGGYLILTLYQRIESKELSEQFSSEDIKLILEDITRRFDLPTPQSERIIRQLLHFFLRNVPEQYGKFELSDHAIRLVELMLYKLKNPYKNYPLKETFEKYFILRSTEIKTITDLEVKFGREFTAGYKRIINDHLATLEEELMASYEELNNILNSDEQSATIIVRRFTEVFRKFGERAEDITYAISSKDGFLRRLRNRVEEFYLETDALKHAQTEEDITKLRQHQQEWLIASGIQYDLELFFSKADKKIERIRRQIFKASTKLSELQENFSRSSNFRLLVRKIFHTCIEQAQSKRQEINFNDRFRRKMIVHERTQLFHPVHYDFGTSRTNRIQNITRNPEYEGHQKREIEKEIRRQEIINELVEKGKLSIAQQNSFDLTGFIGNILEAEDDLFIAQNVAMDIANYAAESVTHRLTIKTELNSFIEQHVWMWKMTIRDKKDTPS